MTRDEFYQQALQIIGRYENIPAAEMTKPTVAELRAGQFAGSLIDLTDSLSRLERDEVHQVLSKASVMRSKLVAVASIYYSDVISEDGSNESKTVEPPKWWEAAMRQHFDDVDRIGPFESSDVAISNFVISPAIRSEISSLRRQSLTRFELGRLVNRAALKLRLLLGRTTSQRSLFQEIEGKTVAIVGNARSLAAKDYGGAIDGYDLVVRFNRVPIVSRKSHGFKTNWVATSVPVTQRRLDDLGADRLLWLSPRTRKMTSETIAIQNLYVHPTEQIRSLEKRAGLSRATTGITAIDLLSKSGLSKATLFGFDFYRSQSSSSHQTAANAPHAFDREEVFVRKLVQSDGRFEVAE
ncbi:MULTISPECIES: glycosyltransferase family 29 protein [Alphaproteobacteria]|uniref:glycosyltransferase family 29 protein n=1 Tax=Alphaproteobacteria TaxID=28211 RepID=UPI001478D816|nr:MULTISPECIES: glycosyltransferase family 29 protein [Alphaproteobacteria]